MNYTILSSEDYQTGQIIDLIKNGSIYTINFTDKEIFYTVNIRKKEKANKIYLEMINNFINGLYSFNQRIELIKKEIQENE